MLDDAVGWFFGELLGWVMEAVFHLLGILWKAYVRVLNLPILVAVALDCTGGVVGTMSLIDSTSRGLQFLGLGLAVGIPIFFLASLIAWSFKLLDGAEENERCRLASGS